MNEKDKKDGKETEKERQQRIHRGKMLLKSELKKLKQHAEYGQYWKWGK